MISRLLLTEDVSTSLHVDRDTAGQLQMVGLQQMVVGLQQEVSSTEEVCVIQQGKEAFPKYSNRVHKMIS